MFTIFSLGCIFLLYVMAVSAVAKAVLVRNECRVGARQCWLVSQPEFHKKKKLTKCLYCFPEEIYISIRKSITFRLGKSSHCLQYRPCLFLPLLPFHVDYCVVSISVFHQSLYLCPEQLKHFTLLFSFYISFCIGCVLMSWQIKAL